MKVLIDGRRRARGVRREAVRDLATTILHLLRSNGAELSILLVGDDEMAELNRVYRHKEGPTDVIAFAMGEGEFPGINPDLLGDVVISLDTAARQAKEGGRTLMEEVRALLIHGILHLHGYDHEQGEAERRRMERKERALRKALILPRP